MRRRPESDLSLAPAPHRSSAARSLLLGRRALVGRRGRFNRHSWQLCLGGLVVARLVAGRTLARRYERVDERERRGGRCSDQHCGHYQDKKHPAHGFHLPSRSLRCSHGSKQEVLGESSTCTIFGELRRIPLPRTPVNKSPSGARDSPGWHHTYDWYGGSVTDRYCRNCGHELAETDRFCPNCGTPVHEAAHVPTPEADVDVPSP